MIPRSEDPDPYDSLRAGSGAHGARLKNIPQGLKPALIRLRLRHD